MAAHPLPASIAVHQIVHGYRSGHQRLAGSMLLSRESERTILRLSDLSGSSVLRGFEEYLTGYPLPAEGMYALARTWYATEMPRPGSVWTHTLLIDNTDLARFADPRWLLRLFERPAKDHFAVELYARPRTVPPADPERWTEGWIGLPEGIVREVMLALYEKAAPCVLVPSEGAAAFEDLVLAIWAQQWPRLRRSFRFCTGSLAGRSLDEKPFDLQVIPQSRASQIRRASGPGAWLVTGTSTGGEGNSPWIPVAVADLREGSDGQLRRFFALVGADVAGDRRVFGYLSSVYMQIIRLRDVEGSIRSLVDRIGELLPEADAGLRLKTYLFGGLLSEARHLLPHVSEAATLEALCSTGQWAAFDAAALAIRERAARLWEGDQRGATRVLGQLADAALTPLGMSFLAGVAEAAPASPMGLSGVPTSLIGPLLEVNIDLAFTPTLWNRPADEQRQILSRLPGTSLTPAHRYQLASVLLRAADDAVAQDTVPLLGPEAIAAILDYVQSREQGERVAGSRRWSQFLASNPGEVIDWLQRASKPTIWAVGLAASLLDPLAADVRNAGVGLWPRLLGENVQDLELSWRTETFAFALALGLSNVGAGSDDLVVLSFQAVHDTIEQDRLSIRSWRILEPVVAPKTSWWWRRDDRLYRLHIGLVISFSEHHWPLNKFIRCFQRFETFCQTLADVEDLGSGRKFRRRLAEAIAEGRLDTGQLSHCDVLEVLRDPKGLRL